MKIEFKKSGENAYSTLSDLGISALFTSRQSDRAGSQGWTVLGLADRAKRMQPQGQGEPPRRGVSPAHKGTPISMSMRAYLWLNGAPCTRSTRFSQLKAPEKFPCSPRFLGFPHSSVGKESSCNAGDSGSIPGSGRSPGEGNCYLLQHSCLESHGQRSLEGYSLWGHSQV